MDLKMEIYTPALELKGILEVQRSVIANTAAFSAGSFSIYSLITDETSDLLQPENIVAISDDVAGIIEHVEEESDERGPYITIKGRLLSGILDRRILWGLYDLTGTPAAIMRYLVNDCAINPTRGKDAEDIERRKIPGLVLADGFVDSGDKIRKQNTGSSLLEALEELGETYQVAFGVRVNPKTQLMEFWTRNGVDRSIHQLKNEPVFFSTELDDVLSSAYTYDSKNYKNIALIAGEGEGLNRTSTVVEKFEDNPAPPAVETCTITLAVDPAGTGTVSGGGEVRVGRKTTVKAAPSSGYEFVAWKQGTNTVSTSESYTFTATEDMTLTAVFSVIVPTYHIQTAIDPAGGGTASGAGYYKQGNTVTLTASPANGFKFVAWRENGSNVSTNRTYTFTASDSRTITAVFSAVYTVTTTVDPAGSGTATGAGSYDDGQSVTVAATPSSGYKFVAWNVDGVEVSTSASYTFTISGNTTITAVFAVIPQYTITTEIDPAGSGTVTGGGTYAEGKNVILVAASSDNYNFVAWRENGSDVSSSTSYSFTASADRTITAVFEGVQYNITATVNPTGSGTVTGAGSYKYGDTATLIATAATNYKFKSWTKGTTTVSTDPTYSFSVVGNQAYIANMEVSLPAGYTLLNSISSSGITYIDTGFAVTNRTLIEGDFSYNSLGVSKSVCGCTGKSGTSNAWCYLQTGSASSSTVRGALGSIAQDIVTNIKANIKYHFLINTTTKYCGFAGTSKAFNITGNTPVPGNNIYLFAVNSSGTASSKSSGTMYYCKIYNNYVLVRDFVPCKNASNQNGMYDLVGKKFYPLKS